MGRSGSAFVPVFKPPVAVSKPTDEQSRIAVAEHCIPRFRQSVLDANPVAQRNLLSNWSSLRICFSIDRRLAATIASARSLADSRVRCQSLP